MRRLRRTALLILSTLLMAACVSVPTDRTTVLGSWKVDNYDKKFSDLLVIALTDESGIRDKFEEIMVNRLGEAGLQAAASSSIMPIDKEINRGTVKSAMAGKGMDGVLVARLLNVERSAIYVPPSPDNTLTTSFSPIITTPGYVEHGSVINLQFDLYDAASEHVVWSLKSQTVNLTDTTQVINALSDIIVANLQSRGLI